MKYVGNKIPLPSQVARIIKQHMRQGVYPAGSILPSTRMLSNDLGVSPSVAYRAIRELEDDGIVQTHHGKGTVVLENSHAERTAILFAFIQPYPSHMPFEQQVLQYAEQGFSARDNLVVMRSSQLSVSFEREIAGHVVNNGVQGILLWPVENNPNGKFFEKLSEKVPVVLVDRLLDDAVLPAVIFDTYQVGRDIARFVLQDQNRKRLLCVIDNLNISPYRDLVQGFCDEVDQMGRGKDMAIVRKSISNFIEQLSNRDFSRVDLFKEELESLLREGGYDSLFCPQEEFLDVVVMQTGLYETFEDLQLISYTAPQGGNIRSRQYNESGVWNWIIDHQQLIMRANDMIQGMVLNGTAVNEVVKLKFQQPSL